MHKIKHILFAISIYTTTLPMTKNNDFEKYKLYQHWIFREFSTKFYKDDSNSRLMNLIEENNYKEAIIEMDNCTKTVNQSNAFGITPLMLASTKSDIDFIKIIVSHLEFLEEKEKEKKTSYINKIDNDGRTAYDFAIMNKQYKIARFLEKKGARTGFSL